MMKEAEENMPFDAEFQAEVERSQKSAARLLESLSQKLRIDPAVRQAAQFVKRRPIGEVAGEVRRELQPFLQFRPMAAIAAAIVAGYVLGRAVRKP
jgi:hypothetical protein